MAAGTPPGRTSGSLLRGSLPLVVPAALTIAMTALLVIVFLTDRLRERFALEALPPVDIGIILVLDVAWATGIRYAWRTRIFPRLRGIAS